MVRSIAAILIVVLAGCGGEAADPKAEVQSAVEDYLSSRTDLALDNMGVSVDAVKIDGDHAQADVTIAASSDPAAKMQMVYELEKRSGRWRVQAPDSSGGPHGAAPPATDEGGLPPGHPPTNPAGADLPPGHPPLDSGEAAPNPHGNVPM